MKSFLKEKVVDQKINGEYGELFGSTYVSK
jgi:hypothetical protein